MPQVIVWLVRAVGVVVVARWLVNEARRVNAELDALKASARRDAPSRRESLRRDPHTGVYRPINR